jgi:hypothetical protein
MTIAVTLLTLLSPTMTHHTHSIMSELSTSPTSTTTTSTVGSTALCMNSVFPNEYEPVGVCSSLNDSQRVAWVRVANCEESGNWYADGGSYSGGLGISRTNWQSYGGGMYSNTGAEATPDEQILIAQRIQYNPPDQSGYCASW